MIIWLSTEDKNKHFFIILDIFGFHSLRNIFSVTISVYFLFAT